MQQVVVVMLLKNWFMPLALRVTEALGGFLSCSPNLLRVSVTRYTQVKHKPMIYNKTLKSFHLRRPLVNGPDQEILVILLESICLSYNPIQN